ncbi:MAG TPA: protein-methionine-sulfoxide reductase catalytic subunit MsrP [Anaerolineales bacterium]|nr:protein-methionine-sulfoxide reductase catalytic subunit MsrP [Anaerolineales bacterium]
MHRQKFASPYKSSQITPEAVYHNRPHRSRRDFLRASLLAAGGVLLAACNSKEAAPTQVGAQPTAGPGPSPTALSYADELGDPANTFAEITSFNNYYEFSLDKEQVAVKSERFASSPWQVEVGGLVNKPAIFDLDALRKLEQEERVYRMRCVEGWSMVIPWMGFPLRKLLEKVEPASDARYVKFTSLYDPARMPNQGPTSYFNWPYVEGLRMDEAMHDLTLMVTGLYGKELLPQNGAPLRLAVPWKYGFKSIKAIVKIELLRTEPVSLWMDAAPNEYGFYANVNPNVDHPRWTQASERRIGELGRRPTLMFNGYEAQVASLYEGMDLKANY